MEISPAFDSRVAAKKKNFLQSLAGTRKGESLWSFGVFVAIKLMSLFCPALSLIDIAFDHHLYTYLYAHLHAFYLLINSAHTYTRIYDQLYFQI